MEDKDIFKNLAFEYMKLNQREYNKIKKTKKVAAICLPLSCYDLNDNLKAFLKIENLVYAEFLIKRDYDSHEKFNEFYYSIKYIELKQAIKIFDEAYSKSEKEKLLKYYRTKPEIPIVILNTLRNALKTNSHIINFWIDSPVGEIKNENIDRYKIKWYGINYIPFVKDKETFINNYKTLISYFEKFKITINEEGFVDIKKLFNEVDKNRLEEYLKKLKDNINNIQIKNLSKLIFLLYIKNYDNENIYTEIFDFINFIKSLDDETKDFILIWLNEFIDIDINEIKNELMEFDEEKFEEFKNIFYFISEEKLNEYKNAIFSNNLLIEKDKLKEFMKIYWDIYKDENYDISSKYVADLTIEGPVVLYGNGKTTFLYNILNSGNEKIVFLKNFDSLLENVQVSNYLNDVIFFYDYDLLDIDKNKVQKFLDDLKNLKVRRNKFFRIILSVDEIKNFDIEKNIKEYILNIDKKSLQNKITINFVSIDWNKYGINFIKQILPDKIKNVEEILNKIIRLSSENPEIMKIYSYVISDMNDENNASTFLNECKTGNHLCIYNYLKTKSERSEIFILFLLYFINNNMPYHILKYFGMNEYLNKYFYNINDYLYIPKQMKNIISSNAKNDEAILKYLSNTIFDILDITSGYKFEKESRRRNDTVIDKLNELQEKAEKINFDENNIKFVLFYHIIKHLNNIDYKDLEMIHEFLINSILIDEESNIIYYFAKLFFNRFKPNCSIDIDIINYISENYEPKMDPFIYFYIDRNSLTAKYVKKIIRSRIYFNEIRKDIYSDYIIKDNIEDFTVQTLNSQNNDEILIKALSLIELSRFDEAVNILENILERDIDFIEARIALIISYLKKFISQDSFKKEILDNANKNADELIRLNKKGRDLLILKGLILREYYDKFNVNIIKNIKDIIPDIDSIFANYPNFSYAHYVKSQLLYILSVEEIDYNLSIYNLNSSNEEIYKALNFYPYNKDYIFQRYKIEKRYSELNIEINKNLKLAMDDLNFVFDVNNIIHLKEKFDLLLLFIKNNINIENISDDLNTLENLIKERNHEYYLILKIKRNYFEYLKEKRNEILNNSENLIFEGLNLNIRNYEFLEYSIKTLYELYKISNKEKKKDIYEKLVEIISIYNINKSNRSIIFIENAITIYENQNISIEELNKKIEKIKLALEDKIYRTDALKILSILYGILYKNTSSKDRLQYLEESLKYAELYLKENPNSPNSYYIYINRLLDKFDLTKDVEILNIVEKFLNEAKIKFVDDPYILTTYGIYYLYKYNTTKNKEEKRRFVNLAREMFENVLKNNPNFELAHKNLENIHKMKMK
ncbi:MAG: hypothetical protein ACP5JT_03990 [Thermoplasmata archaeon]